MKEKSKSGKHKKDASQSRRKNDEEQILINEFKKELKKDIVGEGF